MSVPRTTVYRKLHGAKNRARAIQRRYAPAPLAMSRAFIDGVA